MHGYSILLALTVGLGAAALISCNDDNDEGDAQMSLCQDVGTKLCAGACACGSCTILQSGGTSTIGFDSEDDCRALYITLGCQDPDGSIDLQACSDDLDDAACADDPSGDPALAQPASCEST